MGFGVLVDFNDYLKQSQLGGYLGCGSKRVVVGGPMPLSEKFLLAK